VTATETSLLMESVLSIIPTTIAAFWNEAPLIGGCNRIYFVEHAACIFRMDTSRYLVPANLEGVGRATVPCRPSPRRPGIRPQASERGICGGRVGAGNCFASSTSVFPPSISFLQCSLSHSSVTRVTKTLLSCVNGVARASWPDIMLRPLTCRRGCPWPRFEVYSEEGRRNL
jgi:hypothetical protein